jgi:hypothetical protein
MTYCPRAWQAAPSRGLRPLGTICRFWAHCFCHRQTRSKEQLLAEEQLSFLISFDENLTSSIPGTPSSAFC